MIWPLTKRRWIIKLPRSPNRLATYDNLRAFTGQPETNPWGYIDDVFALGEGLEEILVMVLQESITIRDSLGTKGR